jgi:replicative DNA helicase
MTTVTQDPRDEVAALRVPPHSVEAEYSVLGGLLIDNNAWDRVADLLTDADFYRPEHKTIFSALGRLINSMRPADVVTVFDALESAGKAEECGGLAYLNQIAQSVPSAANCRRYAEIVRERSILRQLLAKADEAGSIVHGDGTAAEKVEKVQALFAGMESRSGARQPIGMDALMVKVMDRTNAAAEGKAEAWRTGIPGMDLRMNGGMRPGELHILAARPSVGKTSIALQIARRVAADGHPVLILSQEMADDQLGLRMLASAARVDLGHLQAGRMEDNEWNRMAEGVDELARLPIHVDDEPGLTLRAIMSKARRVRGVRLIVLDYLQLSEGEGDNRTAQIGSISRGLKKLAKQLGCCVLALSQLNRAVETRSDKRPVLSDLRDSGEIEQDADVIEFLWPLGDPTEISRPTGCEIAKNRQGRTGTMVLELFGATQTWGESTRQLDSFDTKKASRGFE